MKTSANPTVTIGLIGLGVMGESLALNLMRHGHQVVGFDVNESRRQAFQQATQGQARVAASLSAVLSVLPAPRVLWLMVPAGQAVDDLMSQIMDRLHPGDVVIDGGNSHYDDTERRHQVLSQQQVYYLGIGVSGGQAGALRGPAMMVGGHPQGWAQVRAWLPAIAAHADDGVSCCQWLGEGGAGHFVKMVHNGIEYADMQLLCESYALLTQGLGLTAPQAGAVFASWSRGHQASYLLDISADILSRIDAVSGKPLVDVILDKAQQNGTGRWTSEAALSFGVPTPTLSVAVFARASSSWHDQRQVLSKLFPAPTTPNVAGWPKPRQQAWLQQVDQALLAARLLAFCQGLDLIQTASEVRNWRMELATVTSVWRAGCILRGALLKPLHEAARTSHSVPLIGQQGLCDLLNPLLPALREVVCQAAHSGVSVPCLGSALSYLDGLTTARLPANLLQAQRDYFGAHTYERMDQPGRFHTDWNPNA